MRFRFLSLISMHVKYIEIQCIFNVPYADGVEPQIKSKLSYDGQDIFFQSCIKFYISSERANMDCQGYFFLLQI